jgi:hypothetical protein
MQLQIDDIYVWTKVKTTMGGLFLSLTNLSSWAYKLPSTWFIDNGMIEHDPKGIYPIVEHHELHSLINWEKDA